MTMEHRWGRRIILDLSVTLHARVLGRLRGRLRDLSSGGAFVQTPTALPPHCRAELVFSTGNGGTAQIHRFDSVVSRVTPQGVGLMFLQFDPKSLSHLLLRLESEAAPRLLAAPRTGQPSAVADAQRPLIGSSKEAN